MSTKHVVLHNGVHMPLVGYGTWAITDELVHECLPVALDAGYRMIDTATFYYNEKGIGEVLQQWISSGKLKRGDLFVVTKLPAYAHRRGDVAKSLQESLKKLQLDYVDLFLVHSSMAMQKLAGPDGKTTVLTSDFKVVPDDVDHLETWTAMEDLLDSGLARAIGISNFNLQQTKRILDNCSVKPHNMQAECHIYCPEFELHDFCQRNGMSFTAYGVLGSRGRRDNKITSMGIDFDKEPAVLEEPVVKSVAAKYGKSPAQVVLKWVLHRNIAVIPKSANADRIRGNIQLFDFSLNQEDIDLLNKVKARQRYFFFPWALDHPQYPFEKPPHKPK
uniref:Aldo_ket_red domain-containing protein n=1 Tax=Trichuris muris TaxID=70415 RepID=A0A5S6QFJ0_TRIMR